MRMIHCKDEKKRLKNRVYEFIEDGKVVAVRTGNDLVDEEKLLLWFYGGPLP